MTTEQFVNTWHRFVVERDLPGITSMLADNISFHSPAFFKPMTAKGPIAFLFSQIVEVIPDFRYVATFTSEHGGIVMQFVGTLRSGDREYTVQGVDILTLDEDGKVADFTVMIRPLSTLQALAVELKKRLGGG